MENSDKTEKNKNKKFVQQIFHQGLFLSDQSTSSTNVMESNDNNVKIRTDSFKTCENITNTNEWSNASRKRARNSPGGGEKKQPKTSYWLKPTGSEIPTQNSFDLLEEEVVEIKDREEKTLKPPAIFISNVGNINPLTTLLSEVANNEYSIKILSNDEVRIQSSSSEAYTNIVKHLDNKGTEFHTYKPKQERSFKVILKNLHHSTEPEDIASELRTLGHETTNIWNVKHKITKKPMPMFTIELKPTSNNAEIYKIQTLLHCRVKIEPPHFKREIPQCSNCQRYGHTKGFCHHKPRCVKCAASHTTDQCPRKERSNDVKCVLCDGNHPANYKGCSIYKELQKISFPSLRKTKPTNEKNLRAQQETTNQHQTTRQREASEQRQTTAKPPEQPRATTTTSSNTTERTYSNTLKGKLRSPATEQTPNHPNANSQSSDMQELKQIMKDLMDKMGG